MFKTEKSLLNIYLNPCHQGPRVFRHLYTIHKSIRAKAKVFASARMHSMTIGSSDSTRLPLRSSMKIVNDFLGTNSANTCYIRQCDIEQP